MNEDNIRQDEDVEAHRFHNSDRSVKHDVQPVVSEEDAAESDVEAHRWSSSDRNIKHDVQPVVSEEGLAGEDVEGHKNRFE